MIIYPAIDVLDGKVVRLVKGDFSRKTVYSESPVSQALEFASDGAEWLHLIDLDGARSGIGNLETLVSDIIRESGIKVQLGGGIRNHQQIERLLLAGVSRIVLSSAALENPDFLCTATKRFPGRIALALDTETDDQFTPVRTRLRVRGWLKDSPMGLRQAVDLAEKAGVTAIIHTEIERDGLLGGVAVSGNEIIDSSAIELIASGGVGSLSDISRLKKRKAGKTGKSVSGVIIGRALYERKIKLTQALELTKQ